MILIEILIVLSATCLTIGISKYRHYNDILKTFSALLTIESLTALSIILISYLSLRFLFSLIS